MDRKLAGLYVLYLAAGILILFLARKHFLRISDTSVPEVIAQPEKVVEPFGPPTLIRFTENLRIKDKTVVIDGVEKQPSCEHTPTRNWPAFATVELEPDVVGELICVKDYMGGIKLSFKDQQGQDQLFDLGQNEGDAGDVWQFQAVFTREKDNHIRIEILTYGSSEDIDGKEPVKCYKANKAYVFKNKKLETADPIGTNTKFDGPIDVNPTCLNSDGSWKGLSP